MQHPGFFERASPIRLEALAERLGISGLSGAHRALELADVKPLTSAGPMDLAFAEGRKYEMQLGTTAAGACLLSHALVPKAPASTVPLEVREPYRAFVTAMEIFYPDAMRSKAAGSRAGARGGDLIDGSAEIDASATVEPGAVICAEARIGAGTIVAAGAVVGYRVVVGRDGYIGPGASLMHAIVGDRVILHAGVRIGQDGFGFNMGSKGHVKIPQIGRVIIHDDVEIGANSTIDRGTIEDTVIGAGTKIDNLVQIAHNVVIGRHCVIVAQSGLSGSVKLGDFVVMGARSGAKDHVSIGSGAQLAALTGVIHDVPPRTVMSGWPARPFRDWAREVAALKRLVGRGQDGGQEA